MAKKSDLPLYDELKEAFDILKEEELDDLPDIADFATLDLGRIDGETFPFLEDYPNLPKMFGLFLDEDDVAYALWEADSDDAIEDYPVVLLTSEGDAELVCGSFEDFVELLCLVGTYIQDRPGDGDELREAIENLSETERSSLSRLREELGRKRIDIDALGERLEAAFLSLDFRLDM